MAQQKRYIKKKIRRKVYFGFYLYLIIVLLALFTVASYTWFTMSRVPQVNNMNVSIVSQQGLELSESPGAETWKQELNFLNLAPSFVARRVLKPVTWSDRDQCFYAATYGADGRHLSYTKQINESEYLVKSTYYARSGQMVDVQLQEVVSMNLDTNLNLGSLTSVDLSGSFLMGLPGFSIEDILDGGAGHADKAVRMGFRFTYVDKAGNQLSPRGPMIIFEPNCDVHAPNISTSGYVPTPSIDGTATLVGEEYIDGEPNPRLIRQTATTFGLSEDQTQAQINVGKIDSNPTLFHLDPGEILRIEMYIWLEGQDIDCVNSSMFALDGSPGANNTDDQWLVGNIQFTGSTESQSGMEEIIIE